MWKHALAFLLFVLVSAGCALIPPKKIPVDRQNYLEAVSTSWKEQLLSNLVRIRYGDTLTFLEMTSINTSYELGTNATAGYTHGWHPGGAWGDFRNLFTLSGSVTYLDKPTISYAPMRGEALAKVLIKPIPPMQLLRSYQTGFRADYIFSCCVKSLNDRVNPQDDEFFNIANCFYDLIKAGVIRIIIEEEKAPTKYDVTLHTKDITFKGKGKAGLGDEAAAKAGGKPKKVKTSGKTTDNDKNDKEEKEEPSVALLVLDKKLAKDIDAQSKAQKLQSGKKPPNLLEKVEEFKNLLWPDYNLNQQQGKYLYKDNCRGCHKGPDNSPPTDPKADPKAVNFNDPHFWVGELDLKIPHVVTKGKGKMKKLEMKPTDINRVIAYIKHAFGKYEVYRIIDGNESPPQKDPYCDKIVMRTRSIMQTFLYLSQFIEVPGEHLPAEGGQNRAEKRILPPKYALDGPGGDLKFKIDYKKEHPSDAFVAVRYSGYWFYIDDKNHDSKSIFSAIAGILSLSEPGTKEGAPVLTLPVQ